MNNIEVKNLSKTFSYYKKEEGLKGSMKALLFRKKLYKEAVKNISFSIKQGEFVGFIGPNGAGKTTTLKMLSGIFYPTSGEVRVAGHIPSKRENIYKKKISLVMGQKNQLWHTLPAIETFNLVQKMYEIPDNIYKKRLNELATLMKVKDLLNIQVRKLSMGQRMKCELITSLLHNPEVIFLDEPTIGLDVIAHKSIKDFLKQYNNRYNSTIILTSHDMDDVQDLCGRLIIINEGKIGYDGSIEKIINEYSYEKKIKVFFNNKVEKKDLMTVGRVLDYTSQKAEISIETKGANEKISMLIKRFPIKDISINNISLEEIVRDIFSNNNN